MKITRKNRIINNENNTKINAIIIGNKCSVNPKKKLNLNHTKLFYKDTFINEFNSNKSIKQHLSSFIPKNDIIDIIDIYKKQIYIIIINYNITIKHYNEKKYIDLFKAKSESIYNDIYFYNDCNNCYLNTQLKNDNTTIKLIDLYYYLIGYI